MIQVAGSRLCLALLIGCYASHHIDASGLDAGTDAGTDVGPDSTTDVPAPDTPPDAPPSCTLEWNVTVFVEHDRIVAGTVGPRGPELVARSHRADQHFRYASDFDHHAEYALGLDTFAFANDGRLFATRSIGDPATRFDLVELDAGRVLLLRTIERERAFRPGSLVARIVDDGPAFGLLADALVARALHPRDGYEMHSIHRRLFAAHALALDPSGDLFFASQPPVYDETDPIRVLLGGEELVTAHNPRNGALALRHEGEPELVYAGEVEADGSTELVHVNLASGETQSARVPQDYRRPALALENDGVWVLLPSPSRLFHWRSGSEPVEVPLPVELERGGVAARDGWLVVTGTRERIPHVLVREPCLSDG